MENPPGIMRFPADSESKPRVLVVDDHRFIRIRLVRALEEAGFETATAANGQEALDQFQVFRPDMILLDLIMPGLDGFDVCRTIRALPQGGHTPVLVITGSNSIDFIHRAFEAGATDFTLKTIPDELLVHRARCLLRNTRLFHDLQLSEDRCHMLKGAVDSLQIGVTFADATGKIVYVNPAEAQMHDYEVDELLGREAKELAPLGWQNQRPKADLSQAKAWSRESVNVKRNGEQFPVLLTSIPVRDRETRYLGLVTTCEDISKQKEATAKINQLAYYDNLTGLPNRVSFMDRLQQSLAFASRNGEQVCLMFLDLDNFKDVNDTLGHAMGDKLLTEVARRLESCVRESDLLARLGGDEFVMLLCLGVTQEGALAVAQRVLQQVATPFQIDKHTVHTSASIGMAFYPDDSHDVSSLFRCADTAMYHAKNEGKSRFRLYSTEMNNKIMRRVAIENGLRLAQERGEFILHYQPQWDLKSEQMVGAEALLRWNSAEFGHMSPSEFIPIIENSGLIFSIGEWVLTTACQQGRRLADAGFKSFKIAVNISMKQFKQPNFVKMLTKILRDTGMRPCNLELEFTESVIMEPAGRAQEKLQALKKIGVQASIDDFGTGYSSLNYLRHLPVDRIKIDRSFVADVNLNGGDASIVEAIISMAKSLRLKVLAEGVENHDQLKFLRALGCDEAQGFYLAEPLSAAHLSETLLTRQAAASQFRHPLT